MCSTLERHPIGQKDLPAPYLSVVPKPCSIQRQPDNRTLNTVLCKTTDNVGMVMLDGNGGGLALVPGIASAQVVRVHVMGQHLGLYLKYAFQMAYGEFEEIIGFQVFHVPHMLTEKGAVFFDQTQGIFEFATQCQSGGKFGHIPGQKNGYRHISP